MPSRKPGLGVVGHPHTKNTVSIRQSTDLLGAQDLRYESIHFRRRRGRTASSIVSHKARPEGNFAGRVGLIVRFTGSHDGKEAAMAQSYTGDYAANGRSGETAKDKVGDTMDRVMESA